MEKRSRRDMLKVGGALGALGALSVAAPAQAVPWTWSATGSVAGTGEGTDPRWVWDAEADPLVASLLDRGDVPMVNELLRNWTKNGQPLPAGLPADLRDFMETARRLPTWADPAELDTALDFYERRGTYLGVLYGMASGMMSTAIPHEARAVYYSKGGADMKDRIKKTAKLGYDIGTANAFDPDGEMIVTCVKTRLVHAAVRHLLPRSPTWDGAADEQIPISQADMMVTWHSLATTVTQKLTAWQVPVTSAHSAAFLHLWQLTAHMLGIKDEYIPASWAAANAQAKQVLDPILAPTPEGIDLADILLHLGAEIDGGILTPHLLGAFTRYTLGDRLADWLRIPREPVWDPAFTLFWPAFIRAKEFSLQFPGAPELNWTFDELLRQGVMLFLSEGQQFSIEIPTGNRPN
jgi:endo-cleaving rubber dioxygenase